MCGIVGYIGDQQATRILLDGLRRLEYRGYDSAGLAIWHQGESRVLRCSGKLSGLEELVAKQPLTGTIGIGHTRWATHGRPSVENAHPHKVGGISVVHNGGDADDVIQIPDTAVELQPILTVLPLQLLAYHVAVLKGTDIDQPRNLAKSVTVE